MLQEAHPSTSQPQVVEDELPAGEATKAYFSFLMENYKNTWMQERFFFRLEKETAGDKVKKNSAGTCADVSGSYLRKETGPSSEVAVDHTVCRIPQGSEKIELSNPLH